MIVIIFGEVGLIKNSLFGKVSELRLLFEPELNPLTFSLSANCSVIPQMAGAAAAQ